MGNILILCKFKNCEDDLCWIFTRVYGPSLSDKRKGFWEELGAIKGLWSDSWCVVGDFNMIRFPNERNRGGRLSIP